MRATLVSLITLSLAAPAAFAQTPPAATPAPAPVSTPAPAPTTAPAPAATMPLVAPTPAPASTTTPPAAAPTSAPVVSTAPAPAPAAALTPPSSPNGVPPPAPGTTAVQAPAALAADTAPATPAAPPPAPTDPTAIALLSSLESVCVPAVSGGNMDKLAKPAGFRKSGENYVMRGKGFQLTILAPGSNPHTCHVDIVSPVDPEAPAKPLVVALHNWAAVSRGYTLYRNDKSVTGAQELTTRSWELTEGGKNSALVLTTFRRSDGTPSGGRETSQMLFSANATPAG